jgi:ketosteroid isomerase-like protein
VTSADAVAVVLKFEQAINRQKPEAICSLLTQDSVFIDSLGNRVAGLERLRSAWEGYFKMVPDYTISHDEIFASGNTVAMFGTAQGTFTKDTELRKENFWKTPASWRATVKDEKISVWQVFADNEPLRAIMRKL